MRHVDTPKRDGDKRPHLDEDTLAALYRAHGPALMRALLKLTSGDRGRAEDILQETLMRAWTHPEAIRTVDCSRPWLFTVARRIAIDHYRVQAARVREVADEGHTEQPEDRDPYDEMLAAREIEDALACLPPHHREVLVELHMKGRSVTETARELGIPAGTVKSRSFYAARALRPVLAARGHSEVA